MKYLPIILILLLPAGCDFFRAIPEVAQDPAVQQAAGSVAEKAISGNWVGALIGLTELGAVGFAAYKGVMIRRDYLRKARNEPIGKPTTS